MVEFKGFKEDLVAGTANTMDCIATFVRVRVRMSTWCDRDYDQSFSVGPECIAALHPYVLSFMSALRCVLMIALFATGCLHVVNID